MAAATGKKRLTITNPSSETLLNYLSIAVSNFPIEDRGKGMIALNFAHMAKRLAKSTRKARWITGTTFLMLVVPLIMEMDCKQ